MLRYRISAYVGVQEQMLLSSTVDLGWFSELFYNSIY